MPITLDWVDVECFMRQRGIEDTNELAELAETHSTSMYRVATGKSLPQMETLARMCFHLGCQPGDLLAYKHSEDDVSKPHLLLGLFPIDPQVWKRFRQLDRKWRRSIGRWELESGGMVDFYRKGAFGSKWKGGAGIRQRIDGDWFPVDPIDLLRTRLSQDDYGTGGDDPLKGLYDAAETFANSEIVEAIAESFFKYAFKKNPPKPGYNADDDFGTLDQLEAVYEKDPGVLVARNAYQGYHHHDEIREDRFVAKSMAFESSKRGLEALKAALLGCEIERDWNMLGHYAYANSVDDLIDYAEHHVKPIHSMDKEISQFDGWISNLTGSLANADVALGEVIARGMDDKEE